MTYRKMAILTVGKRERLREKSYIRQLTKDKLKAGSSKHDEKVVKDD